MSGPLQNENLLIQEPRGWAVLHSFVGFRVVFFCFMNINFSLSGGNLDMWGPGLRRNESG